MITCINWSLDGSKSVLFLFISVNVKYDFTWLSWGVSWTGHSIGDSVHLIYLKLHNIHILGSKCCMYNVVFVKVLKRRSYLRQESDNDVLVATSIENILLQVSQGTCHWNLRSREDFNWALKKEELFPTLVSANIINKQESSINL